MQLAFAIDSRNLLPFVTTVGGVLRRVDARQRVVINLVHSDLTSREIRDLGRFLRRIGAYAFLPRHIPSSSLDGFPQVGHVPPISYARLLLPTLLSDLDRILYLDSDLVCRTDITPLWLHDLSGFPMAAVADAGILRIDAPHALEYCRADLKDPSAKAFNAGVMLIDLDRWRQEDVLEQAKSFIDRFHGRLQSADQDILNFIFAGRWCKLSPVWNVPQFLIEGYNAKNSELPEFSFLRNMPPREGCIYHLWGPHKPWNSGPNQASRKLWINELRNAEWFSPARFRYWRVKDFLRTLMFSLTLRLRQFAST